jgi:GntR family transcriptional regulator
MRALPLYLQVKEAILERIASGELRPGDRLPTEDELIREHGVSRVTIRQALELLQHDGLVERFARKGTFVTSRPPGAAWMASSIDDVLQFGAETSPAGLEWKAVRDPSAALRLGVSSDEKIYRLRANRVRNKIPIYFIEAFVPTCVGDRLDRVDLSSAMLISVLEEKLRIPIVSGLEEITAGVADRPLAKRLDVPENFPVLILELTYSAANGKPVEYARTWYRADMFRRRNVLSRGRSFNWRPLVVADNSEKQEGAPQSTGNAGRTKDRGRA